MKKTSLLVQSESGGCQHGNLHNALRAIDWLMSKLEQHKAELRYQPHSHFKAMINLGWKKLNKYYVLSDTTPAYRAAILGHPHFKDRWFESQWRKDHPQWIDDAINAAKASFASYERRYSEEVLQPQELGDSSEEDESEAYNTISKDIFVLNDLDRYLREPHDPNKKVSPLEWWQDNHHRFPVLRHMAVDLLAAPASSSADERLFSKAGHVLNEERWHTGDELAESVQLLKSWYDQELLDNAGTAGAVRTVASPVTPPATVGVTTSPPSSPRQRSLRNTVAAQSKPNQEGVNTEQNERAPIITAVEGGIFHSGSFF